MSIQSPEESKKTTSRIKAFLCGTKSILDAVLGKLISRKLLAFIVATVLISKQTLESGDWTLIACMYIGVQGAIDFYKIRNGISD
jgi:hypothetical protein